MTWLYAVIGVLVLFICIGSIGSAQKKKVDKLKKIYDEALQSKNIQKIIETGREYYKASRPPGKINFGFDAEMAIQNDMKAAGIS